MKQLQADIFSREVKAVADGICFTSNGIIKSDKTLVMGAGVAKSFAERYPKLPKIFGELVERFGNRVNYHKQLDYGSKSIYIISFPTKYHWRDKSDLKLVEQSAKELVKLCDKLELKNVFLPYPAIGRGGLKKEEVEPVIEKILDDRITVLTL